MRVCIQTCAAALARTTSPRLAAINSEVNKARIARSQHSTLSHLVYCVLGHSTAHRVFASLSDASDALGQDTKQKVNLHLFCTRLDFYASAGDVVQLTPTTSKSLSSNVAILRNSHSQRDRKKSPTSLHPERFDSVLTRWESNMYGLRS